ncbi:MAG: hypothetical protein Q8L14_13055 [Myxococcales bacterium]|nr:hypothetical protein [Myxococcales bacterium]
MSPRLSALSLSLVLSACQRAEPPAPAAPPVVPAAAPTSVVDPRVAAFDALDAMDTRKPVPLIPMMAHHQKQNMRDHLVAVQEIVVALAADDFAAVETANARIAPSPQMAQMCNHMGMGAPGFSDQALGFHQTADSIGAAAKKKDRKAVLDALGKTLATCTACHAAWKQAVVDEKTWSAASKVAAPSGDDAMQRQHEMMQRVTKQQTP